METETGKITGKWENLIQKIPRNAKNNELGETQFKTAKLVMQIAHKKSGEEFNKETKNIEKKDKIIK